MQRSGERDGPAGIGRLPRRALSAAPRPSCRSAPADRAPRGAWGSIARARAAVVGSLVVLVVACGSPEGREAVTSGDALVPSDVVATYLDRAPLPPFDASDGLARLVDCDERVRPVWRTTLHGATAFDDVRTAWNELADDDAGVEVTETVTFRDGRDHLGLRDGRVRAGATRDRFDEQAVLVEVRLPCRERRPGDPATFTLSDPDPVDPPEQAFPPPADDTTATPVPTPGPTDALVVDDDTSPATIVPVQPRDPIPVERDR